MTEIRPARQRHPRVLLRSYTSLLWAFAAPMNEVNSGCGANGRDFSVRYDVRGEARAVNYTLRDDGTVKFDFVDGRGQVTTETYSGRSRGGGGEPRPRKLQKYVRVRP